jgi:hypothetical protein
MWWICRPNSDFPQVLLPVFNLENQTSEEKDAAAFDHAMRDQRLHKLDHEAPFDESELQGIPELLDSRRGLLWGIRSR